jgi:hypothetical protein
VEARDHRVEVLDLADLLPDGMPEAREPSGAELRS